MLTFFQLAGPIDLDAGGPEGRNDCAMVNVAILGFGTVGSGVAEVLTGHESSIERKADGLIRLK